MTAFAPRGPVADGLALDTLSTPNFNPVAFLYRPDVNDRTILGHVCESDEYRLGRQAVRPSDGWALDIGAHIGGVAVPLAVDYPRLNVIAVEPIPENADLLRRNAVLNGVEDRVIVHCAAFGPDVGPMVALRYRAPGAQHFIAGEAGATDTIVVPRLDLDKLLDELYADHGVEDVAVTKVDCEGCELHALSGRGVDRLAWITGEFHNNADELVRLLSPTHDVTFREFNFDAVRRC